MYFPGNQTSTSHLKDVNKHILENYKGYLSDEEVRETLVPFLRQNIGIAAELLLGITLAPHQELIIKGWFNRNYSLAVWGRGTGKSFMVAVFICLYCIFEPGSKVALVSANFRSARLVFGEIVKISKTKRGRLFRDAISDIKSNTDMKEMIIGKNNPSYIRALPLSGDRLRGFRATLLVVDEALLVPKDIYESVLQPFLVAKQDMQAILKHQEDEDLLIKLGKMKEEDRIDFGSKNKIILLSSASYSFQDLYGHFYKPWVQIIRTAKYDSKKINQGTYFVSKIGYKGVPKIFMEWSVIEDAIKAGGEDSPNFRREYGAEFTDGSESYFSMRKMMACTVDPGEEPCIQIKGKDGWSYVLGVDPADGDKPNNDHFAMSLLGYEGDSTIPILVNSYTGLGNAINHAKYLYYLFTNFNIKLIVGDNAGFRQFINLFNEMEFVKSKNINLKFIDSWTSSHDEMTESYFEMLNEIKSEYDPKTGRICISQVFMPSTIRQMNQEMMNCFTVKKMRFASKAENDNKLMAQTLSVGAYLDLSYIQPKLLSNSIRGIQENNDWDVEDTDNSVLGFISYQDELIDLTKKECSLVEPRRNSSGNQVFDLPPFMKKNDSATKVRKDSYSSLMLGIWANKIYQNVLNYQKTPVVDTFAPMFIA